MSIARVRDAQGRPRFQFEFSRRLGGRRVRTRKLLPASWSRTRAEAFDRQECARLYAEAVGIEDRQWTIDQAVARYLDDRAVELKSGRGVAQELANMIDWYVGRPLALLPKVAADFAAAHRATLAPATIRNRLRYLTAACRWGWRKHGMGETDPAARVVMPAVKNERQVYIDRRQMLTLARACRNPGARAAIRIGWYSGMRLGEIEAAARDFGRLAFLLADTKNGLPRIVPMHPKIRTAAAVAIGTRFQTGYHFRAARAAVGMDHLHFHDLRHAAASAMIANGTDLYTVGGVLGHKSAASTRRYAHLAIDTLREAVNRLGRPRTSPPGSLEAGGRTGSSPMEARAGVEPTYSDLQSRKRA